MTFETDILAFMLFEYNHHSLLYKPLKIKLVIMRPLGLTFHVNPLHIFCVINIFAIHCFFFPLVYFTRVLMDKTRYIVFDI